MQDEFSRLKDHVAELIERVANDQSRPEAEALKLIAALDLASAAVDYGYALSEGREGYIQGKRALLKHYAERVLGQ
jgi:hypothetical protein